MKKITLISIFTGLILVLFGYYFAKKSSQLITENEKVIEITENKTIKKEAYNLTQLQNKTINYQHLELNRSDYNAVNPCLQSYKHNKTLPLNCDEQILNIIINDFSEENIVNAIVGEAINYNTLSFNHDFFTNLFHTNASLQSKLILGFLNRYRNPQQLQQLFNKYKNLVFSNLPKSVYKKVFEKKLTECITAYEEINQQPNKEAFFEDIYFKADTQYLHEKYWNITFWKRRALEKNDAILYDILKQIKAHYNTD